MYLTSLALTGFRNLIDTSITLDRGVTIIHGQNAAGKSNLLEAMALICLARSPRGATDQLLICHSGEHYYLKATIQTARGEHEVTVAAMRAADDTNGESRGRRVIRKITLDTAPIAASTLYEHFATVTLAPGDTEIVIGSPSERRRFLDIAIAQSSPAYLRELGRYQRIVTQKNAALKCGDDTEPFDELLIDSGSIIMSARAAAISILSARTSEIASGIATDQLTLRYRPALYNSESGTRETAELPDENRESYAAAIRASLERIGRRERMLRQTLAGPHRDDMDFLLAGRLARAVASQGQCRTAIVSAKLAQYDWLASVRRDPPVLLLDELFAELDPMRTAALMQRVQQCEQLIITTAGEPPTAIGAIGKRFEIEAGQIS